MALDISVGMFLDREEDGEAYVEHAERLLRALNKELNAAGQAPHAEPKTWDEVFARHPNKKKKQRELSVRLGFYSSEKYGALADLLDYLELHHTSPGAWPLEEPAILPDEPQWFSHMRAAMWMETVIVPRALDEIIYCDNKELRRIVSAPKIIEECTLVAAACGAYDTGDPNQDWKLEEYDELLARWGVSKKVIPDIWTTAGEPIDLCLRLQRVAENIIWSGAFGNTN